MAAAGFEGMIDRRIARSRVPQMSATQQVQEPNSPRETNQQYLSPVDAARRQFEALFIK